MISVIQLQSTFKKKYSFYIDVHKAHLNIFVSVMILYFIYISVKGKMRKQGEVMYDMIYTFVLY